MDRAGRYVLGLMDDDERERAERDLEIDPAFRDAMVAIAGRMHVFDRMPAPAQGAADDWRLESRKQHRRMPQMRRRAAAPEPAPEPAAVTFGRRRSDRSAAPIVPETPGLDRSDGAAFGSWPARASCWRSA